MNIFQLGPASYEIDSLKLIRSISELYVKPRRILVTAPYRDNKVISGSYDRDTDRTPHQELIAKFVVVTQSYQLQ